MKCPACGAENRAEVRFCRHCGQRLILNPSPLIPAESTLIPSLPPNPVCSACGSTVKVTSRFCPRCGKAMQPPPLSQTPPSVTSMPAHNQDTQTSPTNQMQVTHAEPVAPVVQPAPEKMTTIQAVDQLPPNANHTPEQKSAHTGKKNKKSIPGWIWGAIFGIIVLVVILIVLAIIFIPQVLEGTGLLATHTATAVAVELTPPTVTHTPSPTPTVESPAAPAPVTLISPASVVMSFTPATITVSSQVVVSASLSNESEGLIVPLRCDLIGEFAPSLRAADGVTYTIDLLDGSPPLRPGETRIIVYRMEALEPGVASLGVSLLFEVNTPDHRQVVQSPRIFMTVR